MTSPTCEHHYVPASKNKIADNITRTRDLLTYVSMHDLCDLKSLGNIMKGHV